MTFSEITLAASFAQEEKRPQPVNREEAVDRLNKDRSFLGETLKVFDKLSDLHTQVNALHTLQARGGVLFIQ